MQPDFDLSDKASKHRCVVLKVVPKCDHNDCQSQAPDVFIPAAGAIREPCTWASPRTVECTGTPHMTPDGKPCRVADRAAPSLRSPSPCEIEYLGVAAGSGQRTSRQLECVAASGDVNDVAGEWVAGQALDSEEDQVRAGGAGGPGGTALWWPGKVRLRQPDRLGAAAGCGQPAQEHLSVPRVTSAVQRIRCPTPSRSPRSAAAAPVPNGPPARPALHALVTGQTNHRGRCRRCRPSRLCPSARRWRSSRGRLPRSPCHCFRRRRRRRGG